MFYLQPDLGSTQAILDFYRTPHTLKTKGNVKGRIISWDNAGTGSENTIIVPSSKACGLAGVKVDGYLEQGIRELKFEGEFGTGFAGRDDAAIKLPLDLYHVNISGLDGETRILARARDANGEYPAIVVIGGDTVLYAFDPGKTVARIQEYGYIETKKTRNIFSHVNSLGAMVAKRVPLKVRNYLILKYLQLAKNLNGDAEYPDWPFDNSTDILREVFLRTMTVAARDKRVCYLPFWPNGKKSCFCSTHDVDTREGFSNIPFVRNVERKHGINSAWFVTHEFGPDTGFLRGLEDENCEVGSHGWVHDDMWRSLPDADLEERFSNSCRQFKELKLEGFRAPYNAFHPPMFPILSKYFSYDTSAQETRIYGSVVAHRFGCCTLYPYLVNGLVELPITMPPDYLLINTLQKEPGEVYDVWKETLSRILPNGGLILMQTHPEGFDIGNDRYIVPYDDILADVKELDECWMANPVDVARWWKTRCGTFINTDSDVPMIEGNTEGVNQIVMLEYAGGSFSKRTLDAKP